MLKVITGNAQMVFCVGWPAPMPLHNIVYGPIKPTVSQLESWAVSDNGASEAFNMYEANDIWIQHGKDPQVHTCRRTIWLRRVGMFLYYKFADPKDSENALSWLIVMHAKYSLEPIRIYATKQEIDPYQCRLGLTHITDIGLTISIIS
jgi:hypothetical protein